MECTDYKKNYKAMKKKLRLLIYEQECFFDELKKAQRQLLKVSRDKSFLLDRLLQYETMNDMSSDSESTQSSDSGNEMPSSAPKKKKVTSVAGSSVSTVGQTPSHPLANLSRSSEPPKKRPKLSKKVTSSKASRVATSSVNPGLDKATPVTATASTTSDGPMTREEIERHLELKHSSKPQFLSLDVTSHSLPDDIFSHDNSNQGCSATNMSTHEEDNADLIIDMAH